MFLGVLTLGVEVVLLATVLVVVEWCPVSDRYIQGLVRGDPYHAATGCIVAGIVSAVNLLKFIRAEVPCSRP